MVSIREYFDALYKKAVTEEEWLAISAYEQAVYDMEVGFEEWARANNIDLNAMGANGITVLQYWAWNFED